MSKLRKIIEQYFNNTYPNDIRYNFINWLTNSDYETEKDAALYSVWEHLQVTEDESTDASYLKLESKINQSTLAQKRRTPLWKSMAKIAAILLIPILSFAISFYYISKKNEQSDNFVLVECFVPNGQVKTLVLPDSSQVHLNAGSILIYPQEFTGNTRTLYLSGEANFTVTKDAKKPFIVNTSDMEVTVLGTIFNISAYSDNENTSTTLAEGSVSVELKNRKKEAEPIILKPNEQIIYNKLSGNIKTKEVNVDNIFLWQEGHIVLQRQSIHEVVKVMERKFGIEVYLSTTKYDSQKITAKFVNNESLDEFLSVLKLLIPQIQYKVEKQKVYIY